MISMDKKYQTRSGQDVILITTDSKSGDPVVGDRESMTGSYSLTTWDREGKFQNFANPHNLDLIEVREPREWVLAVYKGGNAYPDGTISDSRTRTQDFSEYWVPVLVREVLPVVDGGKAGA